MKIRLVALLLFMLKVGYCFASDTLILDNSFELKYKLEGTNFEVLKDTIGLSIQEIVKNNEIFKTPAKEFRSNDNGRSDYWIKFKVKTLENITGYVIDIHSPNSSKIDLYRVDSNHEIFYCGSTGLEIPFNKRSFLYKNLLLDMKLNSSSNYTYFIFVKKGGFCRFDFHITPFHYFLYSGSLEYYFLGIFYGVMSLIIIYNLMMFLSLKDKVYLAYVLILLFASLKALSEDRTGAQFIWLNFPYLSYYMGIHIAPLFMLLSYIFYTHSFLNLRFWKDGHSKLILFSLAIHLVFYLVVTLIWGDVLYSSTLVILPFATIFFVVMRRILVLKHRLSTYFAAGSVFFLIIMIVDTLRHQRLLHGGNMLVFSFYFFMVIQSLLLSFSIFVRFKYLINENKNLILKNLEQERFHYGMILKERYHLEFAHELKTFISLIISPIDQLLKNVSKNDKEKVQTIKSLTNKIDLYANQLLNEYPNSIAFNEAKMTEGDLIDFVKEMINSFDCLIIQKQLKVVYTTNASTFFCKFDAPKLEKILFNLISNAIKFSDTEECINIDLAVDSSTNLFTLIIKDTGIGMTETLRTEIANAFSKKEIPMLSGLGAGLYFTKILVENLHGTIEVESEINKGSLFTLKIPFIYLESIENEQEELTLNLNEEKSNVLLVSGNHLFADYLIAQLSTNYQVTKLVTLEETLRYLQKFVPAVVVIDFNLHYNYGFEVLNAIKELNNIIKVLFISSTETQEARSRLLHSKADLFIFKPFNMDDIKISIDALISNTPQTAQDCKTMLTNKRDEIVSLFATQVDQIILKNLDNTDLNVDILVKELGISRAQLYRKFADCFGQSIKEYISEFRIKEAAALFVNHDLSVKEVMARVGFNNRNYFIKCFKEHNLELPSDFKKRETTTSLKFR